MSTQVNTHHEHPDVVGSRNKLGVVLILVADIAFALSVLFVYFYLKQQDVGGMWLPRATEGQAATVPASAMGAWYLTLLAGFGLLVNNYALRGARTKNPAQINLGLGAGALISIVLFVYQIIQMRQVEFTVTWGAYASCYFLITGLSALHFFITIFIGIGNWNRGRLGLYSNDFWHIDIANVWWIWMVVSSLLGAFALSNS